MARPKTVPVRLSDREVEMQREINEQVGSTNMSEGMRYNLAYAHNELVVQGKQPMVKNETLVSVPNEILFDIREIIKVWRKK